MKNIGCINCMFYDVCDAQGPCDYLALADENTENEGDYDEYRNAWEAYTGEDEESRKYFDRREFNRMTGGDY